MTGAASDAVHSSGDGPGDDPQRRAGTILQQIAARALQSNLRRVDALADAVRQDADGALSPSDREAAAATAHQLVGSAGTFGFVSVSAQARQLERFFTSDAAQAVAETDREAATGGLASIRRDLLSGPDGPHGPDGPDAG